VTSKDDTLPGWSFQTAEISAGAYRVEGRHIDGRSVSRTGIDPCTLLKECKAEASSLPEKRDA
jgi:hypothetical protein